MKFLCLVVLCCLLLAIATEIQNNDKQIDNDGEKIDEQLPEEQIHQLEEEAFLKQVKNELGDVHVGGLTRITSRQSYLEDLRQSERNRWKNTALRLSKHEILNQKASHGDNHGDSFEDADETDPHENIEKFENDHSQHAHYDTHDEL
jgi:hypothetical protein